MRNYKLCYWQNEAKMVNVFKAAYTSVASHCRQAASDLTARHMTPLSTFAGSACLAGQLQMAALTLPFAACQRNAGRRAAAAGRFR
jgi:hypothetical protein